MKPKRRSCAKKCRGKGIGQSRNKFMKAMNTTKGKFQDLGRKLKGKGFMKKLKKVGSVVAQGARQAAQAAKDTKILSRGAMLMGRPDLAMAAEQFGAGIGQTRNRMMAAASATKGAFKTFGRKLQGKGINWANRCEKNQKRGPTIKKQYAKYKKTKSQCKGVRGKPNYAPKLSNYQKFVKRFMLDNSKYNIEKKLLMKAAAYFWKNELDDVDRAEDIPSDDNYEFGERQIKDLVAQAVEHYQK
jgi:hypothetical protein